MRLKVQIELSWLKMIVLSSREKSGSPAAKSDIGKRPPPSTLVRMIVLGPPEMEDIKTICLPSCDQAGAKSSANEADSTVNPVPSALRMQMRCGPPMLPSGWRRHV